MKSWKITENGGIKFWVGDEENPDTLVKISPTSNGKGEIVFKTTDGTKKGGEVEPGAGDNPGIGQS